MYEQLKIQDKGLSRIVDREEGGASRSRRRLSPQEKRQKIFGSASFFFLNRVGAGEALISGGATRKIIFDDGTLFLYASGFYSFISTPY